MVILELLGHLRSRLILALLSFLRPAVRHLIIVILELLGPKAPRLLVLAWLNLLWYTIHWVLVVVLKLLSPLTYHQLLFAVRTLLMELLHLMAHDQLLSAVVNFLGHCFSGKLRLAPRQRDEKQVAQAVISSPN